MRTVLRICEMFAYAFLAFLLAYVAGGLTGYMLLDVLERPTCIDIAWGVACVVFGFLCFIGRPMGDRPPTWLQ